MNSKKHASPPATQDHVDRLRAQWAREIPDLVTEPMAVLGRIHRLSESVRPSIDAIFTSHGLDRGGFDVLAALRRAGTPFRLTPTDLYRSLLIASGSLTHRLARLQAAGLVDRHPSPDDGRSLVVELTPRGILLVERLFREDMKLETRLLSRLRPSQRSALADLLRELTLALEPECGEKERR